jgi:hypothetical protein
MTKFNRQQIGEAARTVLEKHPGGIQWAELLREVEAMTPETPHNSVNGGIHALLTNATDIVKVARGTYQLAKYQDSAIPGEVSAPQRPLPVVPIGNKNHIKVTLLESDFYASFAQWLEETAEEVTIAAAIGGSSLKQKWGTPDVLGVLRPAANDIIRFEIQIVSAEIKLDPTQPVTAFGQAVAYRLFSHKAFIAVPKTTGQADLERLKALCGIHGVGLVTFALDKENPDYTTVVPAQLATPDMFYLNEMLRRLSEVAPPTFKKLFP